MEKIKFKLLRPNAKLPKKATEHAAAFDMYAAEIVQESPNYYIVYLGLSSEIPEGYAVRLCPRSSLTTTNWYIPNSPGIVDSDYRGEWQVRFRTSPTGIINIGSEENPKFVLEYLNFPFEVGDRVCQAYLDKLVDYTIEEVDELSSTERGIGGFGSTGIK